MQLERGFLENVLEQHLSSSEAWELPNSSWLTEFSVVRQPAPTDVLSRCKTWSNGHGKLISKLLTRSARMGFISTLGMRQARY